jgi:hypothetical protein
MKGLTTMEKLRASLRWLGCHASAPTGLRAAECVSRAILENAVLVWSSFRQALELPSLPHHPDSADPETARDEVSQMLGMCLCTSVGNPFRRLAVLHAAPRQE